MIVHSMPQRSPEWFQARWGLLTASRCNDAFKTLKNGAWAAPRADLIVELAVERLTSYSPSEGYVSAAMQRGIDCERLALAAWEAQTGGFAETCGLVRHDTLLTGASLDGYVDGFNGVLEVKCPNSVTMYRWITENKLPADHRLQCLHALWLTGAEWVDFIAWDDRMPGGMQLFVVREYANPVLIQDHAEKVEQFLQEVDAEVERCRHGRV